MRKLPSVLVAGLLLAIGLWVLVPSVKVLPHRFRIVLPVAVALVLAGAWWVRPRLAPPTALPPAPAAEVAVPIEPPAPPVPEPEVQLLTGQHGRYELLQVLGAGSTGTVHEARPLDRVDWPLVAIKILHESDPQTLLRFQREIRICQSLADAGVVRVLDAGVTGDRHLPFLVMEHLHGRTLQDLMTERGEPFPASLAIGWMRAVLRSLRSAHAAGIVHRDLKPGNLMCVEGGDIKVMDFGIAREPNSQVTGGDARLGTPKYMSPEHFKASTVTPASDIYSLGMISWEMLAGRHPFENTELFKFLLEAVNPHITPLEEVRPELPVPLCRIVMRMLAPRPEDRYQDAGSVLRELAAIGVEDSSS